MKYYQMGEYEVIVVGAGHAGCEAALAPARMGLRTLMLSITLEAIAMMPCNPSIGGTGKGHLVREIDALGGEMGVNTDKTFLQSRMLNTAKGPAVHSLRAQADKRLYHEEMKRTIDLMEEIIKEGEISDVNLRMLVEKIVLYDTIEGMRIEVKLNADFTEHMVIFNSDGEKLADLKVIEEGNYPLAMRRRMRFKE